MKRILGVKDKGVVFSPSKEGEKLYDFDGGGMRDVVVAQEKIGENKGAYYMSYDGAIPGKNNKCYWNVCRAISHDLINWKKLDVSVYASGITHPDGNADRYKDFCGALSPWDVFDGNKWYRFYLGADHCSPEGIPSPMYCTMLAESDTLGGEFKKHSDEAGNEKHICFPTGAHGEWDDLTVSPGEVLINPEWEKGVKGAKKYMMIYSGSCTGCIQRSLGIARTDDLTCADDYDKQTGNFWQKDGEPIIPPEHDIENSSVYYEKETGLYWLFTNHVYQNAFTDAIWAYWTKDPNRWNEEDRAIAFDKDSGNWAKGAIGFASVIKKDDNTLCLFYDAVDGKTYGHLDRKIGCCEIPLPIKVK